MWRPSLPCLDLLSYAVFFVTVTNTVDTLTVICTLWAADTTSKTRLEPDRPAALGALGFFVYFCRFFSVFFLVFFVSAFFSCRVIFFCALKKTFEKH